MAKSIVRPIRVTRAGPSPELVAQRKERLESWRAAHTAAKSGQVRAWVHNVHPLKLTGPRKSVLLAKAFIMGTGPGTVAFWLEAGALVHEWLDGEYDGPTLDFGWAEATLVGALQAKVVPRKMTNEKGHAWLGPTKS